MLNLRSRTKKCLLKLEKFSSISLMTLLPVSAFAAEDALTKAVESVTGWLTSGPATALIILAIVGAGYLWMFKGVLSKTVAISIMGGAGLIYGAAFIADLVIGS